MRLSFLLPTVALASGDDLGIPAVVKDLLVDVEKAATNGVVRFFYFLISENFQKKT